MTQISLPSVLQTPLRADEPELVMKKTFRVTEVERVCSFPVLQVEPPPIPPSPHPHLCLKRSRQRGSLPVSIFGFIPFILLLFVHDSAALKQNVGF